MSDEITTKGAPLPRILGAVALNGRKVKIMWSTGRTAVVDLTPALASRRIYIPLRDDDALFNTLRVSEFGDAIEWADGLDFSALWLERLPEAEFTNADFRDAMDQLGMSLDGMAAGLEISRRKIADYRKNDPIPNYVAYATRYLMERAAKDDERDQMHA